ncbi:MAG TPA: MmcQ/YjbR family DNA-binding protein, partial [Dehalococcoidia bacterium]|nr:MmcQ/YjbR family DNA-binding protein [Dehalococcoidia bacterium]
MTFDDVIRLAADLPGVETGTSYGTPALRVGKKFMCRLR